MKSLAAVVERGWLDRLAHDLRGPLAPLQTAIHLLRKTAPQGEQQGELLAIIERQGRQLARMLDELEDWTRATQARLLGPLAPCEPMMLVDNVRAQHQACALNVHAGDGADTAVVHGDAMRLTQALRILIGFAGARGGDVALDLRLADGWLAIEVASSDTPPDGARFDAAAADQLFEAPHADPQDDGLGLRLLVARAIVEAHDGRLRAESRQDRAVLRCELPLAT